MRSGPGLLVRTADAIKEADHGCKSQGGVACGDVPSASSRMRVLFVSRSFPRDLRTYVSGGFQRMAMFIEAIGGIADLDMLFYVRPDMDMSPEAVRAAERSLSTHWNARIRLSLCPRFVPDENVSRWRRYANPALSFFKQPGCVETSGSDQVNAFETCLSRKPDAIFAHDLVSMCPPLLTREPLPPVFFDLDNIAHVALVRGTAGLGTCRDKLVRYSRLPSLWWGERRAVRLAKKTFVCSELDREYLANRCRLPGIVTVHNAVKAAKLLPASEEPTLLFLGTFWYQPNVDAAAFLIERVWPRIRRAMPEARLIIAGVSPESIPGYNTGIPGVEFTGFVDDLEALYRRACVVCAPILSGAGTRVKIIEAAAYGRPVVSTRIGAEGLSLRDGHELLLRDEPDAFADACLQLLGGSLLRQRIGAAAHAAVLKHYLRDNVVQVIQGYIKNDQKCAETLQPVAEAVKT
jgi:glycosyltransferase involved in cell wall biosynthesis